MLFDFNFYLTTSSFYVKQLSGLISKDSIYKYTTNFMSIKIFGVFLSMYILPIFSTDRLPDNFGGKQMNIPPWLIPIKNFIVHLVYPHRKQIAWPNHQCNNGLRSFLVARH